jgi:hypothetical protein
MQVGRFSVLTAAIASLALAFSSGASANHVSVSGSVSATVERAGTNSWRVEVVFAVNCQGIGAKGASYRGDLYLVDQEAGKTSYLGGVFGPSGEVTRVIQSTARWQWLAPLLKVNCFDNETVHGSETIEVGGGSIFIPPRWGGSSRGGDGAGGNGGADGPEDPTEPLRSEGCKALLVGTADADDLLGGGGGDVVFGLAKSDRIRGVGGHDCLLGEAGSDELRGEDGWDRLTGGAGRDRLYGGTGLNAYDAGRGRDFVDSVNGKREPVRCGPGRDRVKADPSDDLFSCEVVSRVKSHGS